MRKSKLSEVIDIISGGTPKTSIEEYWNGNIGWLSVVDFGDKNKYVDSSERTITQLGLENSSTKLLNVEDIIISARGTVGAMAMLKKPMAFNQSCFGLRAKQGVLNQNYLYYYLKNYMKNIKAKTQGSVFETINLATFDMLEIEYPCIEEQEKRAAVLCDIDNKIEINNQLNEELESIARLVYDYWFIQFDFPNEDGKPYKTAGGTMVWNYELKRNIPTGWSVKRVKDCIKHINTGLNPRDNFVLGNGNIKYITVKNLTTKGTIDFLDCDYIDEKARELVHNRSDVSKNDILFASIAPLGRCVIVQENPDNWDINESVFCIRPDNTVVSTEYLYMFFMSDYFIKKAEHNSTGSVFSGIRISTLEDMLIVVPPVEIKEKFQKHMEKILYLKYRNEMESQELMSLRDFILPMLMNGQIGFKEA